MSDTQNNTQNAPVGALRPADAQPDNMSGNGNAAGNNGQANNAPTYTQEQLDSMVSATHFTQGVTKKVEQAKSIRFLLTHLMRGVT